MYHWHVISYIEHVRSLSFLPSIPLELIFLAETPVAADTFPRALCPFAQQCHNPSAEHHACERIQKLPEARIAHLGVE